MDVLDFKAPLQSAADFVCQQKLLKKALQPITARKRMATAAVFFVVPGSVYAVKRCWSTERGVLETVVKPPASTSPSTKVEPSSMTGFLLDVLQTFLCNIASTLCI